MPLCASRYPSPEKAYFYMMNSLLYSRMEAGFPSNEAFLDEDVNVYLAGLLTAMIHPSRHGATAAGDDPALFEAAASARSDRDRYELYRATADRLLIFLGVFRNARGRRPSSIRHFCLTDEAYIARGKTYYLIAQSYAAKIHRKNTAVGDVLGKLSRGFERYVRVLSLMSGEYLNIFKQLSAGEIYHLENAAFAVEQRKDLKVRYDQFLDIYSIYLRKKSPRAKRALITAARGIRMLDPTFRFDIEQRETAGSPCNDPR